MQTLQLQKADLAVPGDIEHLVFHNAQFLPLHLHLRLTGFQVALYLAQQLQRPQQGLHHVFLYLFLLSMDLHDFAEYLLILAEQISSCRKTVGNGRVADASGNRGKSLTGIDG